MSSQGPEESAKGPPADLSNIEAIQDLDVARLALRWALERLHKLEEERAEVERMKARLEKEHAERRAELEREQAELKTELSADGRRRARLLEERIATLRMEQAAMTEELALWREKAMGQLPAMRNAAGIQTERYENLRKAWESEKAALIAELDAFRRASPPAGHAPQPRKPEAPAARNEQPTRDELNLLRWREKGLNHQVATLRAERVRSQERAGRLGARIAELETARQALQQTCHDTRQQAESADAAWRKQAQDTAAELERLRQRLREEITKNAALETRVSSAEEALQHGLAEAKAAGAQLQQARTCWEDERAAEARKAAEREAVWQGMHAKLAAAQATAREEADLQASRARELESRLDAARQAIQQATLDGALQAESEKKSWLERLEAVRAESEGLRQALRDQARSSAELHERLAASEETQRSSARAAREALELRDQAEAAKAAQAERLQALQNEAEGLRQTLRDQALSKADLQDCLAALKTEAAGLRQTVRDRARSNSELQESLAAAEAALVSAQRAAKQASELRVQAETAKALQEGQAQALRSEAEGLRQTLNERAQGVAELQQRLAAAEKESRAAKAEAQARGQAEDHALAERRRSLEAREQAVERAFEEKKAALEALKRQFKRDVETLSIRER